MALARQPESQQITVTRQQSDQWIDWQTYFSPTDALQSVINHIESQPSSRTERNTMRAYLSSLADFFEYLGAPVQHHGGEDYTWNLHELRMPTTARVESYIAHLLQRVSTSTAGRYLAPVRKFIEKLEHQMPLPRSGDDFFYITSATKQFKLAQAIKNPKPEKKTSRPAVETSGNRLTLDEIDLVNMSFGVNFSGDLPDITTIPGKRDLALWDLAVTSGLRASELARLRLADIEQVDEQNYKMTVRGKGNNYDPVGIDALTYDLLTQYIDAWNDTLPPDHDHRITQHVPIFQPFVNGWHIPQPGHKIGGKEFDIQAGLSRHSISRTITGRVAAALPEKYAGDNKFTAHDCRRTCAWVMRELDYEWDAIRDKLRHGSISVTEGYVGKKPDFERSRWSARRQRQIPTDPQQKLPLTE